MTRDWEPLVTKLYQPDKTWFVSDTHFGHSVVAKMRGFQDAHNMDEAMVTLWNTVVLPDHDVFHLGDFAMRKPQEYTPRLNGRVHLILGNHDADIRKKVALRLLFASVQEYLEIDMVDPESANGKRRLVLFHYSMRVWNRSHFGAWQLYGHSHGNLANPSNLFSMDVGVDATRVIRPINFGTVAFHMVGKHFEAVDHHVQHGLPEDYSVSPIIGPPGIPPGLPPSAGDIPIPS